MKPEKITRLKEIIILCIPFLLMQLYITFLCFKLNYFEATMIAPNILFTLIWILFPVLMCRNIGGKLGKRVYKIVFAVFYTAFLTNAIYFSLTKSFFGFNLLGMASEGSAYVLNTVIHTDLSVYIAAAVTLASGIIATKKFKNSENACRRNVICILVCFVILHMLIPFLYGSANKELKWNSFQNARNVYNSFYDKNKAMKACGMFEYVVRDFYITYIKPKDTMNSGELSILDEAYKKSTTHKKNKYTGIYSGKNVIFLQLEGIDSWLLTKETMPNLYKLMSNSMEFKNHYSYYNGGGSTFNSELAVNTGFITPISFTQNAYTFSENSFPYSLANILKGKNYSVNAFHMNSGEYYSRKVNYLNWGYDNYHGLIDEEKYTDSSYELDRELILNKDFYNMMFKGKEPFMDYIITYTPHKPFDSSNEVAKMLIKERYGNNPPDFSEEEYARLMAGETDKMIGLLTDALKDEGLLDNTIIVGYADHYLYTLSDKTILEKYKNTKNNLINNTPFFIWSNHQSHVTVDKVNAQIDILPTVLNLLGVRYTEENYIGNDIFADNYSGYVFFSDGSMYDGKKYTENAELPQIKKNDLTLKYDYFKKIE